MTTTTTTTDIELLRALRGGCADAFQALYRRHQRPLYRFALLRCGSADLAADVVQDVFLGLLSDSFGYDPLRGQLQHFLFGVARNFVMKYEAAQQRHASLPQGQEDDETDLPEVAGDGAGEPLARLLDNEQAERVRRALAQLAPHYRDCLVLYEMHELSYLEIADICKIDIGTVRSRLSRARTLLAKKLRPAAPNLE